MTERTTSSPRALGGFDQLLSRLDRRLRRLSSASEAEPSADPRPSPAIGHEEPQLSPRERAHAAGLIRVNHTGEVCAQALYQGQALVAGSDDTRKNL